MLHPAMGLARKDMSPYLTPAVHCPCFRKVLCCVSCSDTVHTAGSEAGAPVQLHWLYYKIGKPEQRGRTCSWLCLQLLQLYLLGGCVFFKQSVWLIVNPQNTRKIKRTVSRITSVRVYQVLTCTSPWFCISLLCRAGYISSEMSLFRGLSITIAFFSTSSPSQFQDPVWNPLLLTIQLCSF